MSDQSTRQPGHSTDERSCHQAEQSPEEEACSIGNAVEQEGADHEATYSGNGRAGPDKATQGGRTRDHKQQLLVRRVADAQRMAGAYAQDVHSESGFRESADVRKRPTMGQSVTAG